MARAAELFASDRTPERRSRFRLSCDRVPARGSVRLAFQEREHWRDSMAETPTFGRYAEIPYDEMTPEQQDAYHKMLEARGRLPGPNKIYIHNPKLANVMGPLGAHFRTGYSLSEREREIAVVIICAKLHSAYPTNAHERAAKNAGLPSEAVEAMLTGLPTS